jgi:hypothetical protein
MLHPTSDMKVGVSSWTLVTIHKIKVFLFNEGQRKLRLSSSRMQATGSFETPVICQISRCHNRENHDQIFIAVKRHISKDKIIYG